MKEPLKEPLGALWFLKGFFKGSLKGAQGPYTVLGGRGVLPGHVAFVVVYGGSVQRPSVSAFVSQAQVDPGVVSPLNLKGTEDSTPEAESTKPDTRPREVFLYFARGTRTVEQLNARSSDPGFPAPRL